MTKSQHNTNFNKKFKLTFFSLCLIGLSACQDNLEEQNNGAVAALKEAGFTEIYDLKGGFLAWSKENLEIEK